MAVIHKTVFPVPAKTTVSEALHTVLSTQAMRILNWGSPSRVLLPPAKISTSDRNKEGDNGSLLDVIFPAVGVDSSLCLLGLTDEHPL